MPGSGMNVPAQAACRWARACALLVLALLPAHAGAADWQPIDPADLALKEVPAAPGAPAICLYRQIDRDDEQGIVNYYVRIKVLTEAGRKYADVEVPYAKREQSVYAIAGRTIAPDGHVTEFDGKVFDKTILSVRHEKLLARTFTLPDVQVGSIIEYRYRLSLPGGFIYDSNWDLDDELYTRLARYSLRPSPEFTLIWVVPRGLPPGASPPARQRGSVQLELRDVRPFITEESMPPEEVLRRRVEFIYREPDNESVDPAVFWKKFSHDRWREFDRYADESRAMATALASISPPGDPPAERLRKIYARVQKLRNLDFDPPDSEQEAKHDKIKKRDNVADVWEYGYGTARELNWLFCALARAAGLAANPVLVATRDRRVFEQQDFNPAELNTEVVSVVVDGQVRTFDPGVPMAPFGELPWEETAVRGLQLDKKELLWVGTTGLSADESRVVRKALLTLGDDGSLSGSLSVSYSGQDALDWRRREYHEDELARRTALEDEVKALVPVGIDVHLSKAPDWQANDQPLVAEFELSVPGWATRAGRRWLLPAGLFAARESHLFEHAERKWAVYFAYPYVRKDDIIIRVPNGLQAGSLPPAVDESDQAYGFRASAELDGRVLRIGRELSVFHSVVAAGSYGAVREFFSRVRTANEQQVVLAPVAAEH